MAKSAEAFVRSWLRDNLISETVRNADGTLKEQIEFIWPCIQASIAAGFDNVEEDVDVAELVDIAFEAAATGDEFWARLVRQRRDEHPSKTRCGASIERHAEIHEVG